MTYRDIAVRWAFCSAAIERTTQGSQDATSDNDGHAIRLLQLVMFNQYSKFNSSNSNAN